MILLIIRHAESSNNKIAHGLEYSDYMRSRVADPSITELGFQQADLLAQHLLGDGVPPAGAPPHAKGAYGITDLYCSPMLRTLQTAKPVAQALGLRPEVWIDIHEHGGMFEGNPRTNENLTPHPGLGREAITVDYPDYELPELIAAAGWYKGGYEDMPTCYARAIRVARDLRRRASQEVAHEGLRIRNAANEPSDTVTTHEQSEAVIAIISHGTFIDSLIKALFNQIPDRGIYYFHNNTAITRIDFASNGTLFLRYLNRTEHLPLEMYSQ